MEQGRVLGSMAEDKGNFGGHAGGGSFAFHAQYHRQQHEAPPSFTPQQIQDGPVHQFQAENQYQSQQQPFYSHQEHSLHNWGGEFSHSSSVASLPLRREGSGPQLHMSQGQNTVDDPSFASMLPPPSRFSHGAVVQGSGGDSPSSSISVMSGYPPHMRTLPLHPSTSVDYYPGTHDAPQHPHPAPYYQYSEAALPLHPPPQYHPNPHHGPQSTAHPLPPVTPAGVLPLPPDAERDGLEEPTGRGSFQMYLPPSLSETDSMLREQSTSRAERHALFNARSLAAPSEAEAGEKRRDKGGKHYTVRKIPKGKLSGGSLTTPEFGEWNRRRPSSSQGALETRKGGGTGKGDGRGGRGGARGGGKPKSNSAAAASSDSSVPLAPQPQAKGSVPDQGDESVGAGGASPASSSASSGATAARSEYQLVNGGNSHQYSVLFESREKERLGQALPPATLVGEGKSNGREREREKGKGKGKGRDSERERERRRERDVDKEKERERDPLPLAAAASAPAAQQQRGMPLAPGGLPSLQAAGSFSHSASNQDRDADLAWDPHRVQGQSWQPVGNSSSSQGSSAMTGGYEDGSQGARGGGPGFSGVDPSMRQHGDDRYGHANPHLQQPHGLVEHEVLGLRPGAGLDLEVHPGVDFSSSSSAFSRGSSGHPSRQVEAEGHSILPGVGAPGHQGDVEYPHSARDYREPAQSAAGTVLGYPQGPPASQGGPGAGGDAWHILDSGSIGSMGSVGVKGSAAGLGVPGGGMLADDDSVDDIERHLLRVAQQLERAQSGGGLGGQGSGSHTSMDGSDAGMGAGTSSVNRQTPPQYQHHHQGQGQGQGQGLVQRQGSGGIPPLDRGRPELQSVGSLNLRKASPGGSSKPWENLPVSRTLPSHHPHSPPKLMPVKGSQVSGREKEGDPVPMAYASAHKSLVSSSTPVLGTSGESEARSRLGGPSGDEGSGSPGREGGAVGRDSALSDSLRSVGELEGFPFPTDSHLVDPTFAVDLRQPDDASAGMEEGEHSQEKEGGGEQLRERRRGAEGQYGVGEEEVMDPTFSLIRTSSTASTGEKEVLQSAMSRKGSGEGLGLLRKGSGEGLGLLRKGSGEGLGLLRKGSGEGLLRMGSGEGLLRKGSGGAKQVLEAMGEDDSFQMVVPQKGTDKQSGGKQGIKQGGMEAGGEERCKASEPSGSQESSSQPSGLNGTGGGATDSSLALSSPGSHSNSAPPSQGASQAPSRASPSHPVAPSPPLSPPPQAFHGAQGIPEYKQWRTNANGEGISDVFARKLAERTGKPGPDGGAGGGDAGAGRGSVGSSYLEADVWPEPNPFSQAGEEEDEEEEEEEVDDDKENTAAPSGGFLCCFGATSRKPRQKQR